MGGRGSSGKGKSGGGGGSIKSKTWSGAISELEKKGYSVDSADRSQPGSRITLYRNNKSYTATLNRYSNGYEVRGIKRS